MIFGRAQVRIVQFTTLISVMISGRAQAKFSFSTILGLHGAFRIVTPRITENSLYIEIRHFLI